ncbi:MAG TPA: cytochrome c peroxidase [bacterium]|nr:cytochrome c peroxidase [bacterium]
MRRLGVRLSIGLLLLAGGCRPRVQEEAPSARAEPGAQSFNEPIRAVAQTRPAMPGLATLGGKLFADPRLSADGTVSCASCHRLDHGGADVVPYSTGVHGRHPSVNTPSVFNLGAVRGFGWYGVVPSLEAEIEVDLSAVDRMGNAPDEVAQRLVALPEYRQAFADASARLGFAPPATLTAALCAYVETLVTVDAPVDKYVETPPWHEADRDAVLPWLDGGLGYVIFKQYGCPSCHQGANIGGNVLQKVTLHDAYAAIPELKIPDRETDPLRFIATHLPEDRHVIRVPSLRNVAATAPYFHDGSAATLEDAIRAEGLNQLGHKLNDSDVEELARFLRKTSGSMREAALP